MISFVGADQRPDCDGTKVSKWIAILTLPSLASLLECCRFKGWQDHAIWRVQ